ncbi:MAG TPA: HAMP domain-containing sensor histidine kinase [Rhizomicrobium sp.]|jgi:signal transduction histidine kinase
MTGWGLVAHSLSGRLLLLTILYVLLTEVLILLPTLGRYHTSLLESRIANAEIAILPFTEKGGEQLSENLRQQLLARAGAAAVMLTRPDQRELFLAHDEPSHFDVTIDLRGQNPLAQIGNALDCLFAGGNRILHVVSATRILHAQTVELITGEALIRADLLAYAGRLVLVALGISLATGVLVFLSLYAVLVRPMGRLTRAMVRFHENPEDASRIVTPSERRDEIGQAERELAAMQRDILGYLQQKARLAALGSAVAKIQHDLRNILSSAQLASDRLSRVEDPVVKRLAQRIVTSLDHAVTLATRTMRFGRADEHPPRLERFRLAALIDEVGEAAIAGEPSEATVVFENCIDPALEVVADREQLFRVFLNLVRNAAEAVKNGERGYIAVSAARGEADLSVLVGDNGPGIPEPVREKLFHPFAVSTRSAGAGLGLAIARDLARAHGGDVTLESTGESGTRFRVAVPVRNIA